MVPTNVLTTQLATLLADDPTTLAPAALALHVHLIMAPFTPGVATDFTMLTEATFTGHTRLAAGLGNCQLFRDPNTGRLTIQAKEPAGGWHWQANDAVNLPQTIYGYVLTDNGDTITYGSALFSPPVTLLAALDGVDIPEVRFALNQPPLL